MAVIKYSALVSEIKGKLNGSIFQGGISAPIIKNRRSGGGRRSSRWQNRKSALAYVTSTWRGLTNAQKNAWTAAAPNFPRINKFGDEYTPSGYQVYCTANLNRLLCGYSLLTTPPAKGVNTPVSPVVITVSAGPTFELEFDDASGPVRRILVYVSPYYSKGVTRPRNMYRLAGLIPIGQTQPVDITAMVTGPNGTLPDEGRVIIKTTVTNIENGVNYDEYLNYVDWS